MIVATYPDKLTHKLTHKAGGEQRPRGFRHLQSDALDLWRSPTADVGLLLHGEGLEAVCVAKLGETVVCAVYPQTPSGHVSSHGEE